MVLTTVMVAVSRQPADQPPRTRQPDKWQGPAAARMGQKLHLPPDTPGPPSSSWVLRWLCGVLRSLPQGHQQCLRRQPSAVDCGVFLAVLTSDLCAHRYQHTVHVCALQDDPSSLPYGDLTEVSRAGSTWRPGCQGHRVEARQDQLHPHPRPREVPGNVGKSGPPVLILPSGSVTGGHHSGSAPPPLVLGSAWSLLGPLPSCLSSQGRFLAKAACHLEGWLCTLKMEVQRLHCGGPRSVRVTSNCLQDACPKSWLGPG